LDGYQRRLQPTPIEPSLPEGIPMTKQSVYLRQHARGPSAIWMAVVRQCLEIAVEVRPADLPQRRCALAIRAMPIRANNPAKGFAQQRHDRPAAATLDNHKNGRQRTNHRPEPVAYRGLLPAGFIHIDHTLLLNHTLERAIDWRQGVADPLATAHDTAQA